MNEPEELLTHPSHFLVVVEGDELKVAAEVHDVDLHLFVDSVDADAELRLAHKVLDTKQIPHFPPRPTLHPKSANK